MDRRKGDAWLTGNYKGNNGQDSLFKEKGHAKATSQAWFSNNWAPLVVGIQSAMGSRVVRKGELRKE